MKQKLVLYSLLIIGLTFFGCGSEKKQQLQKKEDPNKITLTTLKNDTILLEKTQQGIIFKEKPQTIIIIDIFATWCPPCRAQTKVLSNLKEKYKKQIKIIGISLEEHIPTQNLQNFAQKNNANYPLAKPSPQNEKLINIITEQLKLGKHFPIPLVVMYKDGKVINYYAGATEEEFIESDLKKALGK